MNILSIVLAFVWCFLTTRGASIDNCAASVTAFPPDPGSTECCGVDGVGSSRIFAGSKAYLDDYPWLALIEYVQDGKLKTPCGGALISGKYVLTASHCVVGVQTIGKPENIILGEYDLKNEGNDCYTNEEGDKHCTLGTVKIPIEKIIPHPEYQPKVKEHPYDIALIRMKEMAPYTDFIRPICLPTTDITQTTEPIKFYKAAWGRFAYPSEKNTVKAHVMLPYVPQDICEAAFVPPLPKITLTKNQICAGGDGTRDFCRGDAGFPLSYINRELSFKSEIVGIVSFGAHPCNKTVPTVYTKVFEYMSWILSNIEA